MVRKDRCKDKVLFRYKPSEMGWRPKRLTRQREPDRTLKLLMKKIEGIMQNPAYDTRIHNAAQLLGRVLCVENRFENDAELINTLMLSYE